MSKRVDHRTGLIIDDNLEGGMTEFSRITFKGNLCREGETVAEAYARAANRWGTDKKHAQRLYDYAAKGWFMFASPVISNATLPNEVMKSLPISCYLGVVDDTREGLIDNNTEISWLEVSGGGVGGGWGLVRAACDKSDGVIPHMHIIDALMTGYAQGPKRRGSYAAYLPVSHPDIVEFTDIKNPTGGEALRKCHSRGFHTAVCITDDFMKAVIEDKPWELIDPHYNDVRDVISARWLWEKILEARMRIGEPYLFFIDEANRALPLTQRTKGLKIHSSNLCVSGDTEILTINGYKKISELAGQNVELWNGREFSLSRVEKTSDKAKTRKIEFSNMSVLWVTDEHKFYVEKNGVETEKRAKDLKSGEIISHYSMPEGYSEYHFVTVLENGSETREEATFCANEPKRHRIVLNGIETGNCNEITLPTSHDRTAVCCLSSVNAEKHNEWKNNTQFIPDLIEMLDNVLQGFIDNALNISPAFHKAVNSAAAERALGLGLMGLHSLFQKNNMAFESIEAVDLGEAITRKMKREAVACSRRLALVRGEPEDMKGTGLRNSCLLAFAPNATSSIALHTSPATEPWNGNAFVQGTINGSFPVRNKYLEEVLESYGQNNDTTWRSIVRSEGSVQHLDFLSEHHKAVFRTAFEIDQNWIILHASKRQQHICQSQSINLFFRPDVDRAYLGQVHMRAWGMNLKGLYYCRSKSVGRVDVSMKERVALKEVEQEDEGECLSCHG